MVLIFRNHTILFWRGMVGQARFRLGKFGLSVDCFGMVSSGTVWFGRVRCGKVRSAMTWLATVGCGPAC